MKKKILIFGSNSDLAKKIYANTNKNLFNFVKITKNKIDFEKKVSIKINNLIKKVNPDIIINCAGYFSNNNCNFNKLIKINLKSNWYILNFYLKNYKKINKKTNIFFIGSSSFNEPRKNYILYTATKAALNSIYLSSNDFFKNSNIDVKIIHPPAMNTKMRKKVIMNNRNNIKIGINPEIIANKIIKKFK